MFSRSSLSPLFFEIVQYHLAVVLVVFCPLSYTNPSFIECIYRPTNKHDHDPALYSLYLPLSSTWLNLQWTFSCTGNHLELFDGMCHRLITDSFSISSSDKVTTIISLESEDKCHLAKLVLLGWLAIVFRARYRSTMYYIMAFTILFTFDYLFKWYHLLFRLAADPSDLELSPSYGWVDFYPQVLPSVITTIHFRVIELWVGFWMVRDFHTRFPCTYTITANSDCGISHHAGWTEERVVFTAILIASCLLSPMGLTIYIVACQTYFKRFTTREPID